MFTENPAGLHFVIGGGGGLCSFSLNLFKLHVYSKTCSDDDFLFLPECIQIIQFIMYTSTDRPDLSLFPSDNLAFSYFMLINHLRHLVGI